MIGCDRLYIQIQQVQNSCTRRILRLYLTSQSYTDMASEHGDRKVERESYSSVGERSTFKKILRTRKIMVMHSNERGECCLRTLVDRQRKRYDNAVDVVVRLHGPTDQALKLRHLRVLAHVLLDDDPRTPIQQSVGKEFRQHDSMVTIL